MELKDEIGSWATEKLIQQFEWDIAFSSGNIEMDYHYSEAREELYWRGNKALKSIVEHFRSKKPTKKDNLNIAWGTLLRTIKVQIDPDSADLENSLDMDG